MQNQLLRMYPVLFSVGLLAGCAAQSPSASSSRIHPGPYTVASGDNLNSIAIRAYGKASLWYTLLNANPKLASRRRFALEIGETLTIPPENRLDRSLPKSVFPTQLPADYIIMPGDSLLTIAGGCYGDKNRWLSIYEANRSTLSQRVKQNPKLLIAGEVLRIPNLDGHDQNSTSSDGAP